jgi:hypothetical protein
MFHRSISNPEAQLYAIMQRAERQARKKARRAVVQSLKGEPEGMCLEVLMQETGLTRHACGQAVDRLMVLGRVEAEGDTIRLVSVLSDPPDSLAGDISGEAFRSVGELGGSEGTAPEGKRKDDAL